MEREFEPKIAKGKKRETLKDTVYEIGERIFDTIFERWKEILVFLGGILGVILIISLIFQRQKQKKIENFANFERAYSIMASANDNSQLQEALNILQITDEPKYISKIYKAWVEAKLNKKEDAIKDLSEIIDNPKSPPDVKKIAAIMKINLIGKTNCEEVLRTYEKLKSLLGELDIPGSEKKGFLSSIPFRTYFEVARCAKDKPEIIQNIIKGLDNAYLVEQFISQERAKNILIAKQLILKITSEK